MYIRPDKHVHCWHVNKKENKHTIKRQKKHVHHWHATSYRINMYITDMLTRDRTNMWRDRTNVHHRHADKTGQIFTLDRTKHYTADMLTRERTNIPSRDRTNMYITDKIWQKHVYQNKHIYITVMLKGDMTTMYISDMLTEDRTNTYTTYMLRRGRTNMYIWHNKHVHLTEQIMYISNMLTDNRTNTCTTDMLRRGRTNMYTWHDNLPCWQETGQMCTLLTCWQETEQICSLLTCWQEIGQTCTLLTCWQEIGQTCTSDRTNMYIADKRQDKHEHQSATLATERTNADRSALLTGDRPNTFTMITPPSLL